jgi:ribosomal protein S6
VKRYEGLFILNSEGEESLKATIDRLSEVITAAAGQIETVQKMERRPFARVSDKKHTAGWYVNFIFSISPAELSPLRDRLAADEEVFRVMFSQAAEPKPAVAE